jgi:CRP-like cAMP-binding protein
MTGDLRLMRVDRAGREAVLHVAVAGKMLAEASLFSAAYHCDATQLPRAVGPPGRKQIAAERFQTASRAPPP